MNAIARVLRRQRSERGALQLASPEVKFEIDTETHDPLDVGMYQVSKFVYSYLLCAALRLPCELTTLSRNLGTSPFYTLSQAPGMQTLSMQETYKLNFISSAL